MLASSARLIRSRATAGDLAARPLRRLVELDRDVVVDSRGRHRRRQSRSACSSAENHVIEALVDGRHVRGVVDVQPTSRRLLPRPALRLHPARPPRRHRRSATAGHGARCRAPCSRRCVSGAAVEEGETLGVMEAMKMELTLKAPFDGAVTEAVRSRGAGRPRRAAVRRRATLATDAGSLKVRARADDAHSAGGR